MRNFFNKIAQFMYGRYKNDQLNMLLFVLSMILFIIARFVGAFRIWSKSCFIASLIMQLAALAIFAVFAFRFLSKNIYKRSAENRKFLSFFSSLKGFFSLQNKKFKDRKTHRYVKCPSCKAQLRVPNKKGKHGVRCPKCSHTFETHIRF